MKCSAIAWKKHIKSISKPLKILLLKTQNYEIRFGYQKIDFEIWAILYGVGGNIPWTRWGSDRPNIKIMIPR